MILKRFIMQKSRSILNINIRKMGDYEGAITVLNGLQSNADYLRSRDYNNISTAEILEATIIQDKKYFERSGITWNQLDKLSVIHVTGTKGKGSTCAYCESILRHHGFRTGFFSSPHLVEVRERIRLNGEPMSKELFAQYFWNLYNTLNEKRANVHDMPLYFRFLTIMAFNVFIKEKVDVAIIEVGIGGEYDCTNILRKVPVVGITSIGLDHTNLLGNTIESVAWNKAGIMKEGSKVFTIPQIDSAMNRLKERAVERKSELCVIPCDINSFLRDNSKIPLAVQKTNVNLAVALSQAWLLTCGNKIKNIGNLSYTAVKSAVETCSWPGRYQIINTDVSKFYLDGAHTMESIKICIQWYIQQTKHSLNKKVLVFNTTGNRDSKKLLIELHQCIFDLVIFVPNVVSKIPNTDNKNVVDGDDYQLKRCQQHANVWKSIEEGSYVGIKHSIIKIFPTVMETVEFLSECSKCDVLVTGSLHLVGAALSVIQEREFQQLSRAL